MRSTPDALRRVQFWEGRNGRAQGAGSDIAADFRASCLGIGLEMPIEVRLDLRGRWGGGQAGCSSGCPADMQIVQLHSK